AVNDPNIQARKAPILDILNIGLPKPLNSFKFKLKLPSKRIIATTTDTIGLYKSPKFCSGFIIPNIGSASNSAADIMTIVGQLNFQASHWDPIPKVPTNIISNKRDISIYIFTSRFYYKLYCNLYIIFLNLCDFKLYI